MNNDAMDHGLIPEITLGWRLRIALERADIKADDMAKELGVHRGTITRWTHDIGREPRAIYLQRWADICGVPYQWLRAGAPVAYGGVSADADNAQATRGDSHQYADLSAELAVA